MAREYKELKAIGLHYHLVQGELKEKGEAKTFEFEKIKSGKDLALLIKADAVTPEELSEIYDCYVYGMDLKARASNRESAAPETTIIKHKGKEIDLLKFPVEQFIPAYNAKVLAVTAEQALNPGAKLPVAFATTAKRHIESGAAIWNGNKLAPAPPAKKK